MCGIIGIIARESVAKNIIEGLKKLEYRGYDSCGVSFSKDNQLNNFYALGKIENLEKILIEKNLINQESLGSKADLSSTDTFLAIAHTRWATHGKVELKNTHPISNGNIAVVHNGMIENFCDLKKELINQGIIFQTDTDTEVILHLVNQEMKKGKDTEHSFFDMVKKIKGNSSIVLIQKDSKKIFAFKRKSPLVIGTSDSTIYVSSDPLSLSQWVTHLCYLEDEDVAILSLEKNEPSFKIYELKQSLDYCQTEREIKPVCFDVSDLDKCEHEHYMLKEIFEQPDLMGKLYNFYSEILEDRSDSSLLEFSKKIPIKINCIRIIACGTSYYAGLIARHWFEKYSKIRVQVDIASEFRYAHPVFSKDDIGIVLSQSGETLDTLAVTDLFKKEGIPVIGIVNVAESSIARNVSHVFYMKAGPEIGVASTKSFTVTLLILSFLSLYLSNDKEAFQHLKNLKNLMKMILDDIGLYNNFSRYFLNCTSAIYLGRGTNFTVALEGALKLKELSYIHAEAFAAGELKHGPISLLSNDIPVFFIIPYDEWFDKSFSNFQQVLARIDQIFCLTNTKGKEKIEEYLNNQLDFTSEYQAKVHFLVIPESDPIATLFLLTLSVQLLAYFVALNKGKNIDQPRHLAKSVTVE